MPVHIQGVHRISGFAKENALKDAPVSLLVQATLTSDEPDFHTYIEQLTGMLLAKAGVLPDAVVAFLAVFHVGDTADVYVNDEIPPTMEVRYKRPVKAGEKVYLRDIVDVRRVELPGITFLPTDGVAYCAKIGWKFGLYFDLRHGAPLDLDRMALELGALHRRLKFEHVYKTLEAGGPFEVMLKDGWFPFIEIMQVEFKALAAAYADRFDFGGRVTRVLDALTPERLRRMAERWWNNPVFGAKKTILEAGLSAYLQLNDAGFIACIKTLGTEVEGLLRAQRALDTGTPGTGKPPALIKHIVEKEIAKSPSRDPLTLPEPFSRYLNEVVFRSFDVVTGDLVMSRNTAGHGVAKTEDYTRERALQLILTVDQLCYFA